HYGQADARALLLAKPGIELRHARFRSVLAAKPDRPTPQEIADHDPIGMTFADRNLVYPNRQWPRCARTCELRLHVLHIQRFDRVPIKCQFLRNVRDRRLPTAASDKIGKALGVEGIVGQKLQPLLFHLATIAAVNASHLQFQEYPRTTARKIA